MHTEHVIRPATVPQTHGAAIVVFGPPLPGRRALARALENRIPSARRVRAGRRGLAVHQLLMCFTEGLIPIIEGDFRTAAEREALYRWIREARANPVFVAWMVEPEDARREIYRRYASLPKRYADNWWRLWQDDHARREAPDQEIPPDNLVRATSHESHEEQVERVSESLGIDELEPIDRAPRRVLVVDDDEDQRNVLAEALEELGCEVWRAKDAYEALGIADRVPLDLVVSDQQMPRISGTELARTLTRRHPEVHIAILTGFADEIADKAFHTDGVELLLAKPVRASDLVRLLDELTT